MKADAVIAGGGIRGIGVVGALCCMEKYGYEWCKVAGTSSGAIIASLLVAGYTAKEIKKMIVQINFLKFKDKSLLQRIPLIGKSIGIIRHKGIYSGNYLESWMRELLSRKGIKKFKDVMDNGESRLKIIATDITKKKRIILPDDLVNYGIDPAEFEVAKAIRMSTSIPFYFKPVKLEFNDQINYIVDGGISCNFPIDIFDVEGTPRYPTIGFSYIDANTSYTSSGRTDTLAFLFDIAGAMSRKNHEESLKERNRLRTIFIPIVGVNVTDFQIERQKSIELFISGYRSARDFMQKWDFEEYKNKFCK